MVKIVITTAGSEAGQGGYFLKKLLLYIIIFAALCSIGNYSVDYSLGKHIDNKSPYYLSFSSISAVPLESRVDCWAEIGRVASARELELIMLDILQVLGLKVNPEKFVYKKTGKEISISCSAGDSHEKYQVILQAENDFEKTYAVLTFISGDKDCKLYELEEKLRQMEGLRWNYYYLYTGAINSVVDYQSQEKILDIILKNLDAEKLEVYRDGKVTSITGYSKILEETVSPVEVGKKRYNVQTAVRTDSAKQKTYVYIGSPLILGDY
ncbi:MAG: YwmB family TATA-box binding protein [Syntrophomonadaceae bacterium]|nr:YwmB family TATA-box binding protein [Syntrophomonadaceae bacterium]